MKIATPISTLFENRDDAQKIASESDVLECRDRSISCTLPHQALFHFEAELIHPWSDEQKSFIRSAVEMKSELKLISFHSASCYSNPIVNDGMYQPGGMLFTRMHLFEYAKENVEWLRSFLPPSIQIAVENNNAYPTPAYEHVADGDFLSDLVERCDLKFLFDIAHAHITAHYKGLSYVEYHSSLPLARIIQVHICKWGTNKNGDLLDTHEAPDETVFEEVRQLCSDSPYLTYGTVEYYRDTPHLLDAIAALRSL